MTTYRLMDGASGRPGVGSTGTQPPGVTTYSGPFQAGTVFSLLGKTAWLQGYYWWCPTGGDTGAQKFCLYNRYSTTAESLVSGCTATSGTLTAGAFNYIPLTTPVLLSPGVVYVACTGWSAVNGFPDSNNQFGSTQPYSSGITNGPLYAWSDATNGGTTPFSPAQSYNLSQGVFGTNNIGGTPDPTTAGNMPAGASNSANFWVDVAVSDTPPAGYSGSYRLWPGMIDAWEYVNDTANNFTLGMEFSLSQACAINNVWFYSPSGVTQLPTAIGVYQVSGPSLVVSNNSPSWSGAAGSGWMSAALTGTLSAGVNYKVVVLNGAGTPAIWNAATAAYWAASGYGVNGLTSGPITAPNNASATSPGQDSYNPGATMTYPNTNVGPYNYWLDIEVTPLAGAPLKPLYVRQAVNRAASY